MPCYVLYAIANIDFKTIEAMATGQSGQIEFSLTRIQNIKIPLPPKAIQEKIISEINVLEKKKVKAKETIRDLRNSIFLIIENSTSFCIILSYYISPMGFYNFFCNCKTNTRPRKFLYTMAPTLQW
jgi:restriction endonuclease S subunit